MKNNQKIILILIIPVLLFTSFMAIFISSNIKDNGEKVDNYSNNVTLNKKISRLIDADEYFAVQSSINDFYVLIIKDNKDDAMSILDYDYIKENEIDSNNLTKVLNINNFSTRYYADEIYFNDNSDITYYFVKGYLIDSAFETGNTIYYKNICYLLIVDNNNHYSLKPLDNISNLEEYANNYELKEITINNNSQFRITKIEDKIKIIGYINSFNNLMFLDLEKAYNMLDEETKKNYPVLDNFENDRENIYNSLFNEFWATSTKENEDNTVYKVQDKNRNTITITEYYPNDFKIGFKFV